MGAMEGIQQLLRNAECGTSYIPGEAGRHLLMREIVPKRTLLEKAEALLLE
jgi:hypothetical protein